MKKVVRPLRAFDLDHALERVEPFLFRWGPCRGCNIIQCNLPRAGGLPAARRRTSTARASCDKKRYAGRLCPEGQRDGAAVLLDEARRMRATTSAILPTVVM